MERSRLETEVNDMKARVTEFSLQVASTAADRVRGRQQLRLVLVLKLKFGKCWRVGLTRERVEVLVMDHYSYD